MARRAIPVSAAAVCAALFAGPAAAQQGGQLTFSLDFQGPLMGTPGNAVGTPITDGDILRPSGISFSPDPPRILIPGAFLSAYQNCAGHAAGIACGLEINAFSFGRDARLRPSPSYQFQVLLSVDEFARGVQPPGGTLFRTVFSEAQAQEAAGDIFGTPLTGVGPFLPTSGLSFLVADGDGGDGQGGGRAAFGLGLLEPLPPTPGGPDPGDNIDALDMGAPFDPATDRLYFSLQGGFPLCREPGVQLVDAASLQSVLGSTLPARAADVLVFEPGAGIRRYATAAQLGLDRFGVGTDDIDALVVVENGIPGYQPPLQMYDWTGSSPTDLILFSLRCGSRTLDLDDANFGIPMSPGDVLMTLGGLQPTPGIFIPAERLGLETVSRGGQFDDDLDGLDVIDNGDDPWVDCNGNNINDTFDIVLGNSLDENFNGIPDECEPPGDPGCDCATGAPCGNTAGAGEGCANSIGLGGKMTGLGTSSIFSDSLSFEIENLPPLSFGLVFMGSGAVNLPLGNGNRCVGATGIYRVPVFQASLSGAHTEGPGLLGILSLVGAPTVTVGSTWGFQTWYRDSSPFDPNGPCNAGSNLTNSWNVTFTP